jgi:4-amino-4-deoxy-L-arabinose transferase-like glycosyltransferase
MGEAPGGSRRFTYALALIALGALVLRVVYVVAMRDHAVLSDGFHYHQGALYLADGRGFINPLALALNGTVTPDAVHPPAWELVLAGASWLGMRSYLSHQLVAAVVGTGAVVVVGLAGRKAFGPRVGLVAAAIAAVYANFWLYERDLVSEPLAMLAVALVLWCTYRLRERPTLVAAVLLGLSIGLAAMTRAELVFLGPLLAAPLVLSRTTLDWGRRVVWLGAAGGACVLLIAPWAIYNTTRFERFVPLSNGAGNAMSQGNCEPTYEGDRYAYYEFGCLTRVKDLSSDPSIADAQQRSAALRYMREHKGEAVVVSLARVGRAFNVYSPFQQARFETERGSPLWVLRLALISYWVLAPLAVVGVVVARRRRQAVWPLLVVVLVVVLSILPSIGAVRYRAPAEVPIVLLAGLTIDAALRRWLPDLGRRSSRPEVPVEPSPSEAVEVPA